MVTIFVTSRKWFFIGAFLLRHVAILQKTQIAHWVFRFAGSGKMGKQKTMTAYGWEYVSSNG